MKIFQRDGEYVITADRDEAIRIKAALSTKAQAVMPEYRELYSDMWVKFEQAIDGERMKED